MPRRVIATVAAVIATATIGLVVALWWAGTAGLSGAELVNARFNALRTGLSIGVGGGGIFALYLAWRRQHATEIGLVQKERDQADVARAYELQRETAEHTRLHAERVAATTERDAEARRINDLYAKSVEQLGSDKAPVRHGGLYALERLAQDHPDNSALRQTVANVLCAYLRAPFDLPSDAPQENTGQISSDEHRERVQEREVRLTAQRILTTHLNLDNNADPSGKNSWEVTSLDLTGAVLIDWNVTNCLLHNATFRRATFIGDTYFSEATFAGVANFVGAKFVGYTRFDKARFIGDALFDGAAFTQTTWFDEVIFTQRAGFEGVDFTAHLLFNEATFNKGVQFGRARFSNDALFRKTKFEGLALFGGATFIGNALFGGAKFGLARLDNATFSKSAQFGAATFTENAWFTKTTFTGDASFEMTVFANDALFDEVTFSKTARFQDAKFYKEARFANTIFAGTAWYNRAIFTGKAIFEGAVFAGNVTYAGAKFASETQFMNSIFRHSSGWSSWPTGWRLSSDRSSVEGREGAWHHLLEVAAKVNDSGEPTSELTDD